MTGIISLSIITVLGTGSLDLAEAHRSGDRTNGDPGRSSRNSRSCKISIKRLQIQKDLDLFREVDFILTQLAQRFARHAQLETQLEFANDEITALYSMLSMIRTTHPEIELEILDLQRTLRKVLLASHTIAQIQRRILMELLAGSLMELALMLRQKNPSFYSN